MSINPHHTQVSPDILNKIREKFLLFLRSEVSVTDRMKRRLQYSNNIKRYISKNNKLMRRKNLSLKQYDFLLHVVSYMKLNDPLFTHIVQVDELLSIAKRGFYFINDEENILKKIRSEVKRIPDFKFVPSGSEIIINDLGQCYSGWESKYREFDVQTVLSHEYLATKLLVTNVFIHPESHRILGLARLKNNKKKGIIVDLSYTEKT